MIDVSQLEAFADRMERAVHEVKPKAEKILEEGGDDLLKTIQDEIMRAQNVDTRLLLSSFSKGDGYNIYEKNFGAMTLKIGTRVEYASWVNDGHSQQAGRFVPGTWNGDKFVYTPGARTGMVLKRSFVPGSHYFDKAVEAGQILFEEFAEREFSDWLNSVFG